MGNNSNAGKPNGKSFKEKLERTIEDFRPEEKMDDLKSFAKTHNKDAIAYAVLIAGLIISLFSGVWGGLLVGIVTGIYFSQEISYVIKNHETIVEKLGVFRSFVLGGAMLGVFIAYPMFYIGMAIVWAIKFIVATKEEKP